MRADRGSPDRHHAAQALIAGRYQLTRLIARGGMGEVFAAFDMSKQRPVALKRLLARSVAQRGPVAHFMREYHALSSLRHPRIIEVYEYGLDGDAPFYTMELLDGQDLRDLSPLPYREACRYLRDVASSLALLHARRLLHRDVSPRNVRRTGDGHCKLLDFGAMIAFGIPPNVTGTAPCIPPEALRGSSLDQRSDLYALGALAYCVLTGTHGYAVSQIEELPEAWRAPLVAPGRYVEIPSALDELVMSLMSLDPMRRPASAAEVIDWLSAVGELEPEETYGAAQSFFTSTPLCGRELQAETITRHVKRAVQGHGGALLLSGGLGSGKSRMLSEAVLIGQTCGVSVAHAVGRRHRSAGGVLAHEWIAALQQVAPVEADAAGAKQIVWPRLQTVQEGVADNDASLATASSPAEQRGRLQQALTDVIVGIARARPVLLTVDDLERADELSIALVSALAHEARTLPLLIIAACEESAAESSTELAAYRSAATTLRIGDLDPRHSELLARSIFGSPPNIQLVVDWLYKSAHGNPKLTLELSEHLYKHEIVRYVDGAWVVPPDEISLAVPSDVTAVWALRVQGLSAEASALLELLCLRRGGVSTELCLAASMHPAERTFSALDELVRMGIVESAGSEYVFAQEVVRGVIEQRMDAERRCALHRRWADALLAEPAPDLGIQLEAGWHLVHTHDESRGADLLAEVAPVFVDRGLSLAAAIPALEKALELSERLGRPLALQLRLRSALVLAGYLFDYHLVFRYGEKTLALLHRVSGMAMAGQLSRWVGPHVGLFCGFMLAAVRRWCTPKARRGPPVFVALQYLVRAAMGVMGVRATSLDASGAADILHMLSPLAGAPSFTSGPTIYLACRALSTQLLGREAEHKQQTEEALAALRRGRRRDMSEYEYHSLLVGVLLADGITESYRTASEALARADLLDGIGTQLARASALRVRMLYYARRGDAEKAEECRRLIELQAIQGGTVWQGEWFSVPLECMAGTVWSDIVGVRRGLDRLERLAREVPSLGAMRDSTRIAYHFRRGEYARASKLGVRYAASHPPRSIVGWPATYSIIALSLVELGQAQQARKLCEDALSYVSREDMSYFVMYAALEVAHATALAVTGEYERAKAIVGAWVERLRSAGEHASLAHLHEYQARMAQLVGDSAGLAEALHAMREAALTSGLPAVILLADRVAELRARRRSSPTPRAATVDAGTSRQGTEHTAMTRFLMRARPGRSRGREALWLLARYEACDEAHLYRLDQGVPTFVSSVPDGPELDQVTAALRQAVARLGPSVDLGAVVPLPCVQGPEGAAAEEGKERWLMLPIRRPERESLVGAVVLRATTETQLQTSGATMLAELASILAEDVRSGSASTQMPR